MCVFGPTLIGMLLIVITALILIIIDLIITKSALLRGTISTKNIFRIFLTIILNWPLLIITLFILYEVSSLDIEGILIPLGSFLLFLSVRVFLLKKFFKVKFIKTTLLSIVSMGIFIFLLILATPEINDRFNTFCINDVLEEPYPYVVEDF